MTSRVLGWIASLQRKLSGRVHQDGDALARERGWAITATTGKSRFVSHDGAQLSWPHVGRSARRPVFGPGGGHQPAWPERIQPVTGRHVARLGPPAITPGQWPVPEPQHKPEPG